MAQTVRPLLLRQWPKWNQNYFSRATLLHPSLSSPPSPPLSSRVSSAALRSLHSTSPLSARRSSDLRPRGLNSALAFSRSDPSEGHSSGSESDADAKKSRNERKREARRAVRWGMDLASFTNPRIKSIIRAASLEKEVFDALMLVKRFGSDVKEGKRRQFNYIGKLLRDANPELMDSLIQATKAGDNSKFRELFASSGASIVEDNYWVEDEGPCDYIHIATRWFEGLISKDIDITNEVYSVNSIEFDRQELRKLVRKVHSIQAHRISVEENMGQVEASLTRAKRSLARFLQALAKKMPTE